MITLSRTIKLVFVTLAVTTYANVWATPMSFISITGPHTIWGVTPPNVLTPGVGTIATALTGNALNPGGNIELGKFGGPVATLSGSINGNPITLSSLVLADWTAGGNALATNYIQGAATAAGLTLTSTEFANALNIFLNVPVISGLKPWQFVSDPNISYVDGDSTSVSIGLAGFLDASPFLSAISGYLLPPGNQASEVVKVTYNGNTNYLYGFSATPSGLQSPGFPNDQSFTGNYAVPLPGILWLFGIGFAGLLVASRRRSPGY